MDDILTSLIDFDSGQPKKEFKSVQSRFQRLHVPYDEVEWCICEQCGQVINRLLVQQHNMHHDMIGMVYQLYHYELEEEKRRKEQLARIQEKEVKKTYGNTTFDYHRQYRHGCFSRSSLSDSLSSLSNTDNNDNSSSRSSSTSTENYEEEILLSSRSNTLSMTALRSKQQQEHINARKNFTIDKINNDMGVSEKTLENNAKQRERVKKVAKEHVNSLEHFDHQLCLQYLGNKYNHAYVDLRKQKQCNLFDSKGRVSRANLIKLDFNKTSTPLSHFASKRRRTSLRKTCRFNGDGLSDEFIALI